MPTDWRSGADETRGEPRGDESSNFYAADDHLSETEARKYAPIIVEAGDKSGDPRPYENDADEIFVHEDINQETWFSITLASLYTIFNPDFLITNNITCIVNMAGCNAAHGAAMYYFSDIARNAVLMERVNKLCGSNIQKLLEEGEEAFKQFYKEAYGIDWLAIEGVADNWYHNIGQHFTEVNAFLAQHLQENKGVRHVKIVVNCYAGYNRSACVAIAFLLQRFPEMSLEEILHSTCPKRPLMLSKAKWWPNQVQSKFVKELIKYEERLRSLQDAAGRRRSGKRRRRNKKEKNIFDAQ